jgi:YD repeat-containing protein
MSAFVKFEEQVVDKLIAGTLIPELISSVKQDGTLVSYEYTGYGYFLTITHPQLPETRFVCSQPMVTASSGEFVAGFVIFLENHRLTFEAYPVDGSMLPANFREMDVHITTH